MCDRMQATGCTSFDHGDCFQFCTDADDLATDGQCATQFDAYESCVSGLPDICTANSSPDSTVEPACSDKVAAYGECVLAYCNDNPSKDYCTP
jgi:hypothetical protein